MIVSKSGHFSSFVSNHKVWLWNLKIIIFIIFLLFEGCTSDSDGGALSVGTQYLLIEETVFVSCKTSTRNGGAIRYSYSNGHCVLYRVCGYSCYSTYTKVVTHGDNLSFLMLELVMMHIWIM